MTAPIRFQFGNREWWAREVTNEANTRRYWIVSTGRPFPAKAEYVAARAFFNRITSSKPKPCLVAAGAKLFAP